MPITDIYSQLQRDEGFRQFLYTDTEGKMTIGYGWNLSDGIPEPDAKYMMMSKVHNRTQGLKASLPWFANLDAVRQGVLQNMAYEMGLGGLLEFHNALTFMQKGDWTNAATEMRASKWYTQVGARAERLAKQVETGEWQ